MNNKINATINKFYKNEKQKKLSFLGGVVNKSQKAFLPFKKIGIIEVGASFSIDINYSPYNTIKSNNNISVNTESFDKEKKYNNIRHELYNKINKNNFHKILVYVAIGIREGSKLSYLHCVENKLIKHQIIVDRKYILNKDDILNSHKEKCFGYYENRESAIECIELIIKKIESLNSELETISKELNCNSKYKKGTYTLDIKNYEKSTYYGKLLISREKIYQLLGEFPSLNFLNGLKHLLEHDKKIQSKHFKEMLNLSFDVDCYFSDIFNSVFETQNDEIYQKERTEKLKKEKERLLSKENRKKKNPLTRIFNKSIKNEENINDLVIDDKNKLEADVSIISNQTLYLYDFLQKNTEKSAFKFYAEQIEDRKIYKVFGDLKKLIEIESIKISSDNSISSIEKKEKLIDIKNKLTLINETFSLLIKEEEFIDDVYIKGFNNQVYFAKKGAGRIYLEEDLKNIPREYYYTAYKLLNALISGDYIGVTTKKYFTGKNKDSLFEVKLDMLRLFYYNLGNDNYQVIMLSVKKADKPKVLTEKVKSRVLNTNVELTELKYKIANNLLTEECLDLENDISEKLLSTLYLDKKEVEQVKVKTRNK